MNRCFILLILIIGVLWDFIRDSIVLFLSLLDNRVVPHHVYFFVCVRSLLFTFQFFFFMTHNRRYIQYIQSKKSSDERNINFVNVIKGNLWKKFLNKKKQPFDGIVKILPTKRRLSVDCLVRMFFFSSLIAN